MVSWWHETSLWPLPVSKLVLNITALDLTWSVFANGTLPQQKIITLRDYQFTPLRWPSRTITAAAIQTILNLLCCFSMSPSDSLFVIPHANQKEGIFLIFFCPNIPIVDLILTKLESYQGVNGMETFITTKLMYYQDWLKRAVDKRLSLEEEQQQRQLVTQ